MARRVKLNHAGLAAILQSGEMHALVTEAAEKVADAVRGQGIQVNGHHGEKVDMPVTVLTGTSDRARAVVGLAHPAGDSVQAKHGALTKGAAAAGLEVRGAHVNYKTKAGKTVRISAKQAAAYAARRK